MTITISLIDALLMILIVFAIVLLYQLIVFVRNLIPSVKAMAKIMDDTSAITAAARTGTENVMELASDFSESLSDVVGILKGNKNKIAAITNLTNALANLAGLAKNRKK